MTAFVGNTRYRTMVNGNRVDFVTKKLLPYDAEIEYLESSGMQYIDTGVYGNQNLKVEFSVQELERGQNFAVFGCFGSDNRCYYLYQSNRGIWQIGFGSYYSTTIQTNTNRNTFLFDNFNVYINGSLMRAFSSRTFTTPHTLLLYSMHNDSGGIYDAKPKKMWYCKMWESGVLIKDFIPVRVGQVGYMYDKVSGQLFGNAGTGDFVLGNDIIEIEYLESDGTQYINTEYYPNDATVITTKYYNQPKGQSPFATRWTGANTYDSFGVYVSEFNKTIVYFGRYSDTKYENISIDSSNTIEMTIGVSEIVVNNNSINISRDSFTSSYPLYLFAMNNVGTVGFKSKTKMYNLKIVEGNTMILDLVPVRVGQVGYMRDKISGKLYGNSGTGSFTLGPDKT